MRDTSRSRERGRASADLDLRATLARRLADRAEQRAERCKTEGDWQGAYTHLSRALAIRQAEIVLRRQAIRTTCPSSRRSATTSVQKTPERCRQSPRGRARKPARKQPAGGRGDDADPGEPPALTFVSANADGGRVLEVIYKTDDRTVIVCASPTGFVCDVAFGEPRGEAPMSVWEAITADLPARLGAA